MWSLPAAVILVLAAAVQHASASGRIDVRVEPGAASMCSGASCERTVRVCLMPEGHADHHLSLCPLGHASAPLLPQGHPVTLSIPFNISWPDVFTVAVQLLDSTTSHHDAVYTTHSVITEHMLDTQITDEHMTYSVHKQCNSHHYGSQCTTYCRAHDNNRKGHYTCTSDGHKQCMDGWKGARCMTPICERTCEHGTCTAPNTCSCSTGYTGARCEQCIPLPGCTNGFCTAAFNCVCEPKWGGVHCEVDLDYCHHVSPCKNGGVCYSGKPCLPGEVCEYTCDCPHGWMGKDCTFEAPASLDTSPCASSPCEHGGTCYAIASAHAPYTCICPHPMYDGPNCEQSHNSANGDHTFDMSSRGNALGGSCIFEGRVLQNEQHWSTTDCRQCDCLDGVVSCTAPACAPGNCLPVSGAPPFTVCPSDQVCHPVHVSSTNVCLSPPCTTQYRGLCTPSHMLDHVLPDVCLQHNHNHNQCATLQLRFDKYRLPVGSTVDDVCHSLLMLLLTNRLTHYRMSCSAQQQHMVQVIMAPSDHGWSLQGVPDVLVSMLQHNQTAFPVLHAVTTATLVHTQTQDNAHAQRDNTQASSALIYIAAVSVCLLAACLCLLLFLCLKRLNRRNSVSEVPTIAHLSASHSGTKVDKVEMVREMQRYSEYKEHMDEQAEYATIDDVQCHTTGNIYSTHLVALPSSTQRTMWAASPTRVHKDKRRPAPPAPRDSCLAELVDQNLHNEQLEMKRNNVSSLPSVTTELEATV